MKKEIRNIKNRNNKKIAHKDDDDTSYIERNHFEYNGEALKKETFATHAQTYTQTNAPIDDWTHSSVYRWCGYVFVKCSRGKEIKRKYRSETTEKMNVFLGIERAFSPRSRIERRKFL